MMLNSPSFKANKFAIQYCTVRKLQEIKNYFPL